MGNPYSATSLCERYAIGDRDRIIADYYRLTAQIKILVRIKDDLIASYGRDNYCNALKDLLEEAQILLAGPGQALPPQGN
jgi:hypothetical protein